MRKFFNRVLALVLCAAMYILVSVPAFADVADWADKFFMSYPNIYSTIKIASTEKSLDNFAKLNTSAAAWRKAIKDYNIPKSELRELFDICWNADSNLFISKYGDNAYNNYFDDCQNLVKVTISCLGSTSLDDFFNVSLYGNSGAELDSDNNVKVPAPVLKDHITTNNNLYYPKNAIGKMSYRTDERWHNMYDGSTTAGVWWYDQLDLYTGNFGFSALGGDDMYMIFFARTNNTDWYGKYQYHLYVTTNDVWYEDRDEIEYTDYTLNYEYWDNIDGSQEQSVKGVLYSGGNHYFDLSLAANFQIGAFSDIQSYTTGFRFSHKNSGSFSLSGYNTVYSTDLQQFIAIPYTHFADSLDFHSTKCSNDGCDVGYLASTVPLNSLYTIDTTKIPDNYYVTVSGDTIYDYSITNPDTGDTTTITNFITNNYNFPPKDDTDTSGGTSGKIEVGGKVEVVGNVDVNVGVDVFVPPVDINVNVNGGNNADVSLPDIDLVENLPEVPQGFIDYLKKLFDFLPAPVLTILIGVIAAAGICRIWGR